MIKIKRIVVIMLVSIIVSAQERFEDIQVPHCGSYFKSWENEARKGDPLAMFELFQWTTGIYNANTDIPLGPVIICIKWQPNAEKIIRQKIKELADKSNVQAMRYMGAFALQDKTSMSYLLRAAEYGDPFAIRDLARTLKYGDPKQNELFDKFEKIVLERAEKGDRRAMVAVVCETSFIPKALVNNIFEKIVKDKDFYTGVAYYLKASKALHISSGFKSEAEKNRTVMEWLEQAAQCGEIRAMRELAQLYYQGKHFESSVKVSKNLDRAWQWARAYREAVGCPSPDVDPPKDEEGKPWKRPSGVKAAKPEL